MKFSATVSRGAKKGTPLLPHRHADRVYVVWSTRFERVYLRVSTLEEVVENLSRGLRLRKSNPASGIRAPSLIEPSSMTITS
jgi:hypothetical protein